MENININLSPTKFKELKELPVQSKFQMVNLLKFKEHIEDTGITGVERYKQYMKAAMPYFIKSSAKIIYEGHPENVLIGPPGEWDKILIVEYNSKEAFINMITSEGYPSELRSSALQDSRLIFCK